VLPVQPAVAACKSLKDKRYSYELLARGSKAEESGTVSSKPAEMSLVAVQTVVTGKLHSSPMEDQGVIGAAL